MGLTALAMLSSQSHAVNWEGHEDFFHEAVPLPELTEAVEKPLLTPLPTCDARRKLREKNPYEQEAIPGKNCREE